MIQASIAVIASRVSYSVVQTFRWLIDAFHQQEKEPSPSSEAYASWGALAMKECVQDALCSLWTEFCRHGLDIQEHDGMTRSELRKYITDRLAGAGTFELGESIVAWRPDQPLREFRAAVLGAGADLHWEDIRSWTEQQNSAMSGLAALLWFEAHTPQAGSVPVGVGRTPGLRSPVRVPAHDHPPSAARWPPSRWSATHWSGR